MKGKRNFDYHVYLFLSVLCIILRILPYSIGRADLNGAINDIAVGGLASTIIAWLIALAEYRKSKKIFEEKRELIYKEYRDKIKDLRQFVANRCISLGVNRQLRTFEQWLFILQDTSNYNCTKPEELRKRNYQAISNDIKKIKLALDMLYSQYFLLIDSGFVHNDDKLWDHVRCQQSNCDDILQFLNENDYDYYGCQMANDMLKILNKNFSAYFADKDPASYN